MNRKIIPALALMATMATLSPWQALADITPGRWLPSGEEQVSLIQRVYTTPRGDIEFLRRGESHSVLLRNVKGALLEMVNLTGPMACDEWFISSKENAVPADCEFVFYSENEGTYIGVRSSEMEESNLFRSVSGSVRERGKNVAL